MDGALLVSVLSEGLYQLRQSEKLAAEKGLPGMLVNGKPFSAEHIDALDEALSVIGANLQVEYAAVCRARSIEPIDDFKFSVNLLRVPELKDMSGRDVFELMVNARHIAGNYWMFEGDAEALRVECEVADGDGVTHGFRDMSDDEFLAHAKEVFPSIDFSNEPPAWRMLSS